MNFLLNQLKKVISLDLRAIALMRIGIGFTIIIDLLLRYSDLEAHYSDYGVLPLEGLFKYIWDHRTFSLYTISNSWQLISILFFLNILCASCLLFGYRTKLFSILSWVFLLSLHNRNPLINQGGDDLLRLILFIGIFLPWGYRYSIDAINNTAIKKDQNEYTSAAGATYLLQLICMYVFSALLKSGPEWTSEFTALYYALSLDQILLPFGKFIFQYYDFLLIMTFLVYYIELLLPFTLVMPFFNNHFRIVFFILFAMMHFGIFLTLNVGLFPLISLVCSLGVLPSSVFNIIDRIKITRRINSLISKIPLHKAHVSIFPKENFFQSNLMIFFSMCILFINFTTLGKLTLSSESNFTWLIKSIRLDQHWAMFAPSVFKDDGWFIFLGKTEKGDLINIHENVTDNHVDYIKPVYVAGTYKNDRWRKYSEGILMISNAHFRPFYCSFLLNRWNRDHPNKKINSLEIIYMKEISLANYASNKPTKEKLCTCSNGN
jgi:hypothetical protein